MPTLSKTTENSFQTHLIEIDQALDRGGLLTTDLQVVEKHGIQWIWIVFTRAILTVVSYCIQQDPWKAYRINHVAQSLSTFVANNQDYVTPGRQVQLEEIFNKLEIKAGRSSQHKEIYLKVLGDCRKAVETQYAVEKPPVEPTPPIKDEEIEPNLPIAKAELTPAQQTVRYAITTFANDLCLRISNKEPIGKSFCISPVSIIAALGMCLHIIEPEKKEQFLEKIGLKGLSETEAHTAISTTLQAMMLPENFEKGAINIAQGLARKPGTAVADSLLQLVQNTYKADIITSDDLMTEVNKWVNAKTREKIPTILKDNNASLVLLNAIYLGLQWQKKFEKPDHGWRIEEFTCVDGTKAPVSMMAQNGAFLIYRGDTFSMLEKPYLAPTGRKLSQLIFLPNDPVDLMNLEKTLTAEAIQKYRQEGVLEYDVALSMPKTKAESDFELLVLLKEMGLPLESIDKNIVEDNITSIIHKTFISNDEEGTKAAAVTAIVIDKCLDMPELFHVNHAYTYLIMDEDTVLFRGRVGDKEPLVVDSK